MSAFLYKNWNFWLLLRKLKSWELWVDAPSWEHGNIDLKRWGSPTLLSSSRPPHRTAPTCFFTSSDPVSFIIHLLFNPDESQIQPAIFKSLDTLGGVPKTNMRSRLRNDVTVNTAETVQASFDLPFDLICHWKHATHPLFEKICPLLQS